MQNTQLMHLVDALAPIGFYLIRNAHSEYSTDTSFIKLHINIHILKTWLIHTTYKLMQANMKDHLIA